jgi:GTP cyclohydrolase IB
MNQRESFSTNVQAMPDVQSSIDNRNIAINRVGIRALRHPIRVADAASKQGSAGQHTVGTFSMSVALPPEAKGTHMSRFVALLEAQQEPYSTQTLPDIMAQMLEKLHASAGSISLSFPYFLEKTAPVSGIKSLLDYDITLQADAVVGGTITVRTTIVTGVTSLCPCSKEVSEYGAHNQRSHITIMAESVEFIGFADIIRIAEENASSELYGLLKRVDEKFVTEHAYDNPKFVEDLVRDVAQALEREPRISAYRVECENFESIHNHTAFAVIENRK